MTLLLEEPGINGFAASRIAGEPLAGDLLANGFTAVNNKSSSPRSVVAQIAAGIAPERSDLRKIPTQSHLGMESPQLSKRSDEAIQGDTDKDISASSGDEALSPAKRMRSSTAESSSRPIDISRREGAAAGPAAQGEPSAQNVAATPDAQQAYQPPDSDAREGSWYGDRTHSRSSMSVDEAGLEERLRKEVSNMGRPYHSITNMHGGTPANMLPPTIETTAAGVQVDPRKRKRNFSNRTKTGCQTCRKRKKKCDEEKPECNNCRRGGFVCEGYTTKTTWGKNGVQIRTQPINLQPKDFVESGGLAPRLPPNGVPENYQHPPLMAYDRYAYETPSRGSGQERSAEYTGGTSYSDSTRSQQYDDKLQHTTARGQPIQQYVEENPPMEWMHSTLKQRNQALIATILEHRYPSSSNVGPQNAVRTAQLAEHAMHSSTNSYQPAHSSHQALLASTGHLNSEKDKMLAGRSYWPYAPDLIGEREACKAALWRFNQAQNPSMDVSRDERARKFRQIIVPEQAEGRRPVNGGGRCGQGVLVDAPFNCSYGYNIDIADDVTIETNCFIEDAAVVHIGKRCIIGPNVCIYTNIPNTDDSARVGRDKRFEAHTVTIEDDVIIGGSVVIRPGIVIKKGAMIHPGTVVDKEVPGHVEWGLKSTGDTLNGLWTR